MSSGNDRAAIAWALAGAAFGAVAVAVMLCGEWVGFVALAASMACFAASWVALSRLEAEMRSVDPGHGLDSMRGERELDSIHITTANAGRTFWTTKVIVDGIEMPYPVEEISVEASAHSPATVYLRLAGGITMTVPAIAYTLHREEAEVNDAATR